MTKYKTPLKVVHIYPGKKATTFSVEVNMKDGHILELEVAVDDIWEMVDALEQDGIKVQFTQK